MQPLRLAFWAKSGYSAVGRRRQGHWTREVQLQSTFSIPPGHGLPPHGLPEVKSGAAWAPQHPPKIRGLRMQHVGIVLACFILLHVGINDNKDVIQRL